MSTSRAWSDPAKLGLGGTERARALEESWAWLWPKARAAGVTRVGNVTGLDIVGIPVWVSVRPNARGLSVSQGKGATHRAAQMSALMESIENWHAEEIELPVRYADHATLTRRAEVANPRRLSYWADAPVRDDLTLNWVEGEDLVSGRCCFVPLETVSTDYVVPAAPGTPLSTFVQSSNGLAGGNSHWEATCHAVAELVERHTIAANEETIRRFDPAIRLDLDSIADAHCRALLRHFEVAGLLVALFLLASDIDSSGANLPVAACSIIDADESGRWRNLPPFNGYGCHLNPTIALSRAMTEAAQSRLTYIAGGREDIGLQDYHRSGHPDDLSAYRVLFCQSATLNFAHFGGVQGSNFRADFEIMAGLLSVAGYDQVIAVDLTKHEIGVPVVRAVIPGLSVPRSLVGGRPIIQPVAMERREAA